MADLLGRGRGTKVTLPDTNTRAGYTTNRERGKGAWDKSYFADAGVTYRQDPSTMSRGQVDAALGAFAGKADSKSGKTWNWYQSLQQRDQELAEQEAAQAAMEEYKEMMAEYMAGMQEYLGAMSEAMTREEPAAEPLKAAQQEMSAAREDTARRQAVRRGLMSTYTRYGSFGGTQRLGA